MSILNNDDMMFLNNKEKKEKANAISYKIDEYIWGRKDFVTDCPYGEKGSCLLYTSDAADD